MSDDLTTTEMGNITSTEDHKMMASFRIDRELWAKFGRLAKSERLTATDVLTDYIQRCTDNDKSEYAINVDAYDADKLNETVTMMVSAAIEASLHSSVQVMTQSALAPITEQVEEIRSFTQSQLQSVRDEIEKALSEWVKSNSIEQARPLKVVASKTKVKKSPPQSLENDLTTASRMSWGEFHSMVELEPPPTEHKNRANADIALDRAKTMGFTGWKFTGDKNFVRK
jgi:hypothetical protein